MTKPKFSVFEKYEWVKAQLEKGEWISFHLGPEEGYRFCILHKPEDAIPPFEGRLLYYDDAGNEIDYTDADLDSTDKSSTGWPPINKSRLYQKYFWILSHLAKQHTVYAKKSYNEYLTVTLVELDEKRNRIRMLNGPKEDITFLEVYSYDADAITYHYDQFGESIEDIVQMYTDKE